MRDRRWREIARSFFGLALTISATVCAGDQQSTIKLDLGPEKAAVMEGFQPLTPKTMYTPERGLGWQPYALGDWKKPARISTGH